MTYEIDLPRQRCRIGVLRRFARAEEGAVSIFALFMVFIMLMIAGIGADLMRHEMERTRIQAVADRAVLAAADLDQEQDAEAVVRDYFAKAGMEAFVSNVIVDEGINYKTVTVDASTQMNTQFMDFVGRETLTVPAYSTAEEKVAKVEISMVLDISGSMRRNNKMDNLHDAAGEFVDTVLQPANRDLISISLIPYTAQVNAGPNIVGQLNVPLLHNFSHCVDFDTQHFDETGLSLTEPYEHMQHFDTGYYWNGLREIDSISNPGCPKRSYEEITAFSQDATALKQQINQFRPRANTAIHIGMKWGVAMLDPSFQSITASLPSIDAKFQSRPAAYSDRETLKTIILMTDGENVSTYRINPRYYANDNHRRHWSIYPLSWYLSRYVRSSDHDNWRQLRYSPNEADNMLQSICDAAKAQRIVIWSIGFEVGDHGANVMRNCASSPSHFFRVEGVEIRDAFSAIANQINQLRLIQ
jgi:Flp pilus assembly protein TadG